MLPEAKWISVDVFDFDLKSLGHFGCAIANPPFSATPNLTATRTNTSTGGAQSISYKSSGKFYFEVTVGASHGSTDAIGIMASTYGYGALTNGNAGAGSGVWLGGGSIINNGGTVGSVGGAANAGGSVICVAHDAGLGKVWYRLNGGNWMNSGTADPATNNGGVSLIAAQYALSELEPKFRCTVCGKRGSIIRSIDVPAKMGTGG